MDRDLSQIAALLSDRSRAGMIMALMDGISLPAGRLAIIGNVAPQTASSHLSKLVEGGLLSVESEGRHRYYRIANRNVAYAVEAMLGIASRPAPQHSARGVRDERLIDVRTCYSHLAGRVAVEITDRLLEGRFLISRAPREFAITRRGHEWFTQLGIELTPAQLKQTEFARRCRDWTERRDHIAGKLGSMMLNRFRELKWFTPLAKTRALRITLEGRRGLQDLLQIMR